jgi:protein-tyrosine phosphatase
VLGEYISNFEAAQNLRTLNRLGIKEIITAANGACLGHSRRDIPHYEYIPGEDHENYDLAKYLQSSVRFFKENLKRTNVLIVTLYVLVHCIAGISRSVTLMIIDVKVREGVEGLPHF